MKKTLSELRLQLIDTLMVDIVPALKYKFNDNEFPLFFAKLNAQDVCRIITDLNSETDRFGKIRNEWLKQFLRGPERELINKLNDVIWWPMVDGVWTTHCFEVKNPTTPHINDLYILVKTGPDEWVGLHSKRCYLNE